MSINLRTRHGFALALFAIIPFRLEAQEYLIPNAQTSSNTTISATIDGATLYQLLGYADTETFAAALSSLPGAPTSSSSFHNAWSTAQISVPLDMSTTLFQTTFSTFAESLTAAPLFSKALATGQSSLLGIIAGTPSSSPSTLNLAWDFNSFNIQSTPSASFSYISDSITISQQSLSNPEIITSTTVGFYIGMEDGKLITKYTDTFDTAQNIENWFGDNINVSLNNLTLDPNADVLGINIPLLDLNNDFVILTIENLHTEYSVEAPPSATLQVAEKAGNFNDDDLVVLHWDSEKDQLIFDPIPIDFLNSNASNQFDEKYRDDSLNGGFLEIDPLTLITEIDGREYFEGNEIRLVDRNNQTIFKASLPSLAFDDGLYDLQEYNLFAPLLNVLEFDTSNSLWLQDYVGRMQLERLIMPELFIGFDLSSDSNSMWDQNFSTSAKVFLSFSGVTANDVPEPPTLFLFTLGFIYLLLFRLPAKQPTKRYLRCHNVRAKFRYFACF